VPTHSSRSGLFSVSLSAVLRRADRWTRPAGGGCRRVRSARGANQGARPGGPRRDADPVRGGPGYLQRRPIRGPAVARGWVPPKAPRRSGPPLEPSAPRVSKCARGALPCLPAGIGEPASCHCHMSRPRAGTPPEGDATATPAGEPAGVVMPGKADVRRPPTSGLVGPDYPFASTTGRECSVFVLKWISTL
jgi:hypothetical protein